MQDFRIFTEGKADIKFLQDYITECLGKILPASNFDTLGSWSGYKAGGPLKLQIQECRDREQDILLVLDADLDFESRQKEVLDDFAGYGVPVKLFLFPNNNNPGNIETLLATIATDRALMDCFLKYEECVKLYPKKLNDARIYSYLDMLLHDNPKDQNGRDLRREEFRNYRNPAHWNLHHEYLQPLKDFLTPFLS
jgi:hypothetical protein